MPRRAHAGGVAGHQADRLARFQQVMRRLAKGEAVVKVHIVGYAGNNSYDNKLWDQISSYLEQVPGKGNTTAWRLRDGQDFSLLAEDREALSRILWPPPKVTAGSLRVHESARIPPDDAVPSAELIAAVAQQNAAFEKLAKQAASEAMEVVLDGVRPATSNDPTDRQLLETILKLHAATIEQVAETLRLVRQLDGRLSEIEKVWK